MYFSANDQHFKLSFYSPISLAAIDSTDIALFGIFIFVVIGVLLALFCFNLWVNRQKTSLSPYSKQPLRRASELSYDASIKVLRYMYATHQYDNRIFDLKKAAVCRETGRLFPNAVTWYDTLQVDWGFLQKRYPGKFVSWGSLTQEQQEIVSSLQGSLEGFQTAFSSPQSKPRAVEAKYALLKPGPLYVDIETHVVLGWKMVPDTDLEVLIVQKPLSSTSFW